MQYSVIYIDDIEKIENTSETINCHDGVAERKLNVPLTFKMVGIEAKDEYSLKEYLAKFDSDSVLFVFEGHPKLVDKDSLKCQ